jgi:hypothetical protein
MLHSKVAYWPLPTNIKLGWKGLPGTNTLAYYVHLKITGEKCFITQAPGGQYYNTLYSHNLLMFLIIYSLMFASKAKAYASEASFRLLALPTNIRLAWKGLPGTNHASLLQIFLSYIGK